MHEDIRGVVHKLHALFPELAGVFDKPPGKKRGEHAVGFRVAGLFAPNVEVFGVDGIGVSLRAAVKVIDVGGHGVAFSVDAADAADDAVTHHGADVGGVVAFAADFIRAALHAGKCDAEKLIGIHLYPARMRVVQGCRGRCLRQGRQRLIVNGDLHALGAGIKAHVKFGHD